MILFDQQQYEQAKSKFEEARTLFVELDNEEKAEECNKWIASCEEAKSLPVLCMAVWVYGGQKEKCNMIVCSGLLFSVLGDIMLERGEKTFLVDVMGFLLAHIVYTGAFLSRSRTPKVMHTWPFAVWGILVYSVLSPHLGDMTIPMGLYIFVICVMMWRASALVEKKIPSTAKGAAGAVFFGLSDTLIALNR